MPTFNTAQYTAQLQAIKGFGGRVTTPSVSAMPMFLISTYTTLGTEVANDLINVGLLPDGVVLIPELCRVSSEALGGTGATIATLGDALDDDRYSATAIPVTAVATAVAFTPTNAFAVTPVAIPEGGEVIKAKLGLTSGAITAARKITFVLAYRSAV